MIIGHGAALHTHNVREFHSSVCEFYSSVCLSVNLSACHSMCTFHSMIIYKYGSIYGVTSFVDCII